MKLLKLAARLFSFLSVLSGMPIAAVRSASKGENDNGMFSSLTEDKLQSAGRELRNVRRDKTAEKPFRRMKRQSQEAVKAKENSGREEVTLADFDYIYLHQIAVTQEFLDENHNADLSRIQCLLQKMLPEQYYDAISQLKEHCPPVVVYYISGGQHVHAPNARKAEQNFEKKGS